MNLDALLGNFPLILLILTIVTGIVWCIDVFYLAKQRRTQANAALVEYDARVAKQQADGVKPDQGSRAELEQQLTKRPVWIEYSGSFFPVIAAVFVLRSFLYEPFKIPSSSMSPTLVVGDMILVNKFAYGIRLPVADKKIIDIGDPQHGDVMVFKYPRNTSLDYIKRVIGVPGDKIVYRNKRLTINGQPATYQPLPDYLDTERLNYSKQFDETLFNVKHRILNDAAAPEFVVNPDQFPGHELCSYNAEGFACTVPPGHYFMMGDNRDNSLDSRFWGFVPDHYIVGRASIIWFNLNNLKRIGGFQ